MSASIVAVLVLQWIVIVGLALVVFAMVRQIGVLHQRIAPAGALMISQGVKVGAPAPVMTLKTLKGEEVTIGGSTGGLSTLLMFVAPDCPVCAQLLPAIMSIARDEAAGLRVVFASDGKDADHVAFARGKGLDAFPYVISTELGMTYQVAKLPYAALLDGQGVLVAQGLVNNREHLESLFEARRLGVATLQDYLSRDAMAAK